MSRFFAVFLVAGISFGLAGCSGAFWGGTGTGVGATGAAYELRARQQMHQVKEDYAAGRIDEREYEIRKSQIEKMSLAY